MALWLDGAVMATRMMAMTLTVTTKMKISIITTARCTYYDDDDDADDAFGL